MRNSPNSKKDETRRNTVVSRISKFSTLFPSSNFSSFVPEKSLVESDEIKVLLLLFPERTEGPVCWSFARDIFRLLLKLTESILPVKFFSILRFNEWVSTSVYCKLSGGKGITRRYFSRDVDDTSSPWLPPRWNEMRAVAYNRKRQKQ